MGLSNGKIERTKASSIAWLEMRKQWFENDAVRDKGLYEPGGIIKLRNLDYKAPFDKKKINTMLEAESVRAVSDKLIKTRINCPDFTSAEYVSSSLFDVYIPQADKEKYPVILSVHGGGWFYGDKELYRFYCMDMAKRGFAVINMNYRLAPENVYPAAIEDVCLCVRYISEYAEALKLDMDHFYMAGDSAGAQLVTNYSIIATNEAYRKMVDFETCDIVPKAVALNCGIYEMREIKEGNHDWYLYGKYSDKPECKKTADENRLDLFLRQLDYMTDKFPPAYLMCSVNDALMVHTAAMKKKLEDLNIRHVYRAYGQEKPDSGHVFHLNLYNPEGRKCNDEEAEFLAYH